MLRQIVKDSFIYSAAGLLSGGAIFFLLPILTRLLPVIDYGIYEYLSIIGTLVGVTVALEVTQALARYVSEVRSDPAQVRVLASTALWFTILIHGLAIALVVAFDKFIAQHLLGNSKYAEVLVAALSSFALTGVINLMITQLQWELRAKESALLSVIAAFSSLALSILCVWVFQLGLIGSFLGPVASGLFVLPVGLFMSKGSFGFIFSTQALRQMLAFSFPLVFSSVGWILASYLDRLAIKELLTLRDLAMYGVGFRIAGMVMLLMTGLQGAVSPMIYTYSSRAETPGRVVKLLRLSSSSALVICGALAAFAPELLLIFATPAYKDAALVVPALALSLVLSRFYIFAPGLAIAKKTLFLAVINISMGVLNFGLNFLMIPYWGIIGAAVATLISACISFGVVMFFSQLYYPVPHRFVPLIVMGFVGFFIMMLTTLAYHKFGIGFELRFMAFGFLVALPFLFRVVAIEEIRTGIFMVRAYLSR